MMRVRAIFGVLCMCVAVQAGGAVEDFGQTVREFSAARFKLEQELSSRLDLPMVSGTEAFFQSAMTGNWESVSNQFASVNGWGTVRTGLRNELWAPIHETFGIWEVWANWKQDSALLAMFHEPILASMPKNSIYFGGTDHGRFVITAVNAVMNPPPVYCLTQNALADNTYAAHIRAFYGEKIWLPSQDDNNLAFQNYVREVQSRQRPPDADIKIENGRVSVQGVKGVMEINALICKMIFDHNKDTHEFFVEESYVINWMVPYLEPCGLIMKLNRQSVEKFTDQVVARDHEFWEAYIVKLEHQPGFATNTEARKSFAKLRAAIAGLYASRKMYPQAESAFRQAFRLCPASPEVAFRLTSLYGEQGRVPDAINVLESYLKICPMTDRANVELQLKQLKKIQGSVEQGKNK